ncbi:MAG: hypothetical protein EA393_09910 [Bacteroidetes bacterium]|nr:MAG: hypothetical protein EA393_09910 [Bacteroidota bacterium]
MQEQKPRDIIRNISFIYWAMLLGLVTFIVVTSLFVSNVGEVIISDPQTAFILKTVLILTLIVIAPISYLVPQRKINRIKKDQKLNVKLAAYHMASLIRFVLMNSAGILIALGFMLTANTNLIFLQAVVILFFLIYKPSPFKIASDMDLDEKERQQIMPE